MCAGTSWMVPGWCSPRETPAPVLITSGSHPPAGSRRRGEATWETRLACAQSCCSVLPRVATVVEGGAETASASGWATHVNGIGTRCGEEPIVDPTMGRDVAAPAAAAAAAANANANANAMHTGQTGSGGSAALAQQGKQARVPNQVSQTLVVRVVQEGRSAGPVRAPRPQTSVNGSERSSRRVRRLLRGRSVRLSWSSHHLCSGT